MTNPTHVDFSGEASDDWLVVPRPRFHAVWAHLPRLVALVGVPGWGRTTWMRQCEQWLSDVDELAVWVESRAQLESILRAAESEPAASITLLVDDVLFVASDPLWWDVAAFVSSSPLRRAVISSLDLPNVDVLDLVPGALVLDERQLCFTSSEIDEVIAANFSSAADDVRAVSVVSNRGCPYLLRLLLQQLDRRNIAGAWGFAGIPANNALITNALENLSPSSVEHSEFFTFIDRASTYRRFTHELVATSSSERDRLDVLRTMARLRASPLGAFDVNDATGHEEFEWTPEAWRGFEERTGEEAWNARIQLSLEDAARRDDPGMELFYGLTLGQLTQANDVCLVHFRVLVAFAPECVKELLLGFSLSRIDTYPHLLQLASELRLRRDGRNSFSTQGLNRVLTMLRVDAEESSFGRFRVMARRLAAACALGDRELAHRQLDHAVSMLRADGVSVLSLAASSPEIGERVSAEMYWVFWAATQLDRQEEALWFAELGEQFAGDFDQGRRLSELSLASLRDLAGLRSTDHQGVLRGVHDGNQLQSFLLIETGDDARAAQATRVLTNMPRPAPTRSIADGAVLLSKTLSAPDQIEHADVGRLIDQGRAFWTDGEFSTFVGFAATCAYLALGAPAAARALWKNKPARDYAGALSLALLRLQEGNPGEASAMLALAEKFMPEFPRFRVLADVLGATALLHSGHEQSAGLRLASRWRAAPAPRLYRFAFHFISDEDLAQLTAASTTADASLRTLLAECAGDTRFTTKRHRPRLTPSETEIVQLLREGRTNAEIATARFVSENTVRTQIKAIFRKLGVNSRADAVQAVEE